MANDYKQSIEEVKKLIVSLTDDVRDLDTAYLKLSESVRQTNKEAKTPIDVSKQLKEQERLINSLNSKIDKQAAAIKKLNGAKKKQTNLLTEQEKLQKKLESSIQNLVNSRTKEHAQTIRNRKALTDYNRSLRKGAGEQAALTVRVKAFFKTLVAFDLARRLVDAFWSSLKSGFSTLKLLDSVRLQFKFIIDDMVETRNTMHSLNQMSNAFGANLLVISNRYLKFRAAAKQANLGARETRKIFQSVTKAAGVLGLKTDELKGIYLALEQMLSKGKVTTEELRRQLGERLPGAMGIMANAVGVTVAQLDVMLKKGEVLSADVLPAFARALEKSYNLENVERIDTIQAAQTRLTNSWIEFVQWLEKTLKLNTKISKSLDWLASNFKNLIGGIIALSTALVTYLGIMKLIELMQIKNIGLSIKQAIANSSLIKSLNKLAIANGFAASSTTGLVTSSALIITAMTVAAAAVVALTAGILVWKVTIGDAAEKQDLLNEAIDRGTKDIEAHLQEIEKDIQLKKERIKLLEKEKNVSEDNLKADKNRKKAISDIIKLYEQRAEEERLNVIALISQREEFKKSMKGLDESSPLIAEYTVKIDLATEAYNDWTLAIRTNKVALANVGTVVENSIAWYEKLISSLEKKKKLQTDTSGAAVRAIQTEIDGYKKLIKAIIGAREAGSGKRSKAASIDAPTKKGDKGFDGTKEDLLGLIPLYEEQIRLIGIAQSMSSDDDEIARLEAIKKALSSKLEQVKSGDANELAGQEAILEGMDEITAKRKQDLKDQKIAAQEERQLLDNKIELYDYLGAAMNSAADLASSLVDRAIADIEREQAALEDKYNRQKELIEREVGDEASKKERLRQIDKQKEKDDDALEKRIIQKKRKQAIIDKANAIFQIGINTLIWASSAAAEAALGGFVTTPMIIAIGAAQAAAVLAQPLPQYKHGGEHKGGLAVVGDGGKHEAAVLPSGEVWKTPKSDTVVDLPKGTNIYPDFDKFQNDNKKMQEMAWGMAIDYNFASVPKKQDNFSKDLRKDVMKSLSGLTINNHSHEVAEAVKSAIVETQWTNGFL